MIFRTVYLYVYMYGYICISNLFFSVLHTVPFFFFVIPFRLHRISFSNKFSQTLLFYIFLLSAFLKTTTTEICNIILVLSFLFMYFYLCPFFLNTIHILTNRTHVLKIHMKVKFVRTHSSRAFQILELCSKFLVMHSSVSFSVNYKKKKHYTGQLYKCINIKILILS